MANQPEPATPNDFVNISATIPCVDPATGERLGEIAASTPSQVRERIELARQAQYSWSQTPFSERRKVLRTLLSMILDQADELCQTICRDSGKTLHNAMVGEIWPICEKLRWTISQGERHLRPESTSSGLLVHKRSRIEFHPRGVVGVICPWNFPLQNILGPTIPALFAGNAVVVKVSEWVAWSAARFEQLIRDALVACGYSPDLVQIIVGYGDSGAAMVSGGCDLIIFTGSMTNGQRVLSESAKSLTPVILELGGKDPLIVCDDADLDRAAHAAACGCFISSGQMCLATERVLVFDSVYEAFISKVKSIASKLRQGPPLQGKVIDVGAMTMPAQVDIVQELVDDALKKGATLICGGQIASTSGQFFQPTILADVRTDMRITQEETFGPVMSVLRVANESEAIRVANDCPYGLSSSIFSKDQARARRIGRQIQAGSTCINDFALMYMVQDLPFGGVRGSGFGRLNGREGLRACTNQKAVIDDRIHRLPPTKIFPLRQGDYNIARAAISMIYRKNLRERVGHAFDLARNVFQRD